MVFQDFMAYDLSARENIAIGRLDLMEDSLAIEAAVREAGIDTKLRSLSRGHETPLTRLFFEPGEDVGVYLPAASDSDLLILDEPSSGLDAEAEHELHSRISALRTGRISLLISHRFGAIRHDDTLAVLEDGVFTEVGTPGRERSVRPTVPPPGLRLPRRGGLRSRVRRLLLDELVSEAAGGHIRRDRSHPRRMTRVLR
ncbi:ABC transporter ATP-binding protein/permease [Herbidospora yilanensis]|uniref:ABC transporter ATP-binding protein/permease n=1 Tax=Herbidospora yilanensis TaxID=354426 RepID=UPI000785C5F4|nr:ABC transporter ATP-binding protein/permease [Herbidospora yilanensis]